MGFLLCSHLLEDGRLGQFSPCRAKIMRGGMSSLVSPIYGVCTIRRPTIGVFFRVTVRMALTMWRASRKPWRPGSGSQDAHTRDSPPAVGRPGPAVPRQAPDDHIRLRHILRLRFPPWAGPPVLRLQVFLHRSGSGSSRPAGSAVACCISVTRICSIPSLHARANFFRGFPLES